MVQPPEQLVVWRRVDGPGHDACGLWHTDDNWRLRGTAVFVLDGIPCWLDYEVCGNLSWRTRTARVTGWMGGQALDVRICLTADGRWRLNGNDQPAVAGCTDLDFSFTPATNLIPLRRLGLAVGSEAQAAAAWLNLLGQRLDRLDQHYRRSGDDIYDYRAPSLDFSAALRVSHAGFITHYPGLWEMEALQ
ncbi:MAG: putative glycolipid-binding domain-containing protein [Thiohalomonadaceae bacterium]